MKPFTSLAAAALLTLVATASQAQAPGKVHFANVMAQPVDIQVGAGPQKRVPPGNWVLYDTAPGTHRVSVQLSNGRALSQTGAFDNAALTPFGKGLYWCVAVVPQGDAADADGVLLLLNPEQCKRVLDAGNPID